MNTCNSNFAYPLPATGIILIVFTRQQHYNIKVAWYMRLYLTSLVLLCSG